RLRRDLLRRAGAARLEGAVRGPGPRIPGPRPYQRQGSGVAAARPRRVLGDLRPGHALHRHDRVGARGRRRQSRKGQAQTGQEVSPVAGTRRHLSGRHHPFDRLSRPRPLRPRDRHQSRQDQPRALRSRLGQGRADDAATGDVRSLQSAIDRHTCRDRGALPSPACGGGLGRGWQKDSCLRSPSPSLPVNGGGSRPSPLLLFEPNPRPLKAMTALQPLRADRLKAMLADGQELAIVDLREELIFSQGHLLFARSVPLSRLELKFARLVPRRGTRIVLYDDADGLVERAADILPPARYTSLHALDGGVAAWAAAGFELFSGVNVPSKAFGEFVEHASATPSIDAGELERLMRERSDIVVLDSRPFDEYQRVSIPSAVNVPGAELVLRIRDLAPSPQTMVVVNCAGRTRS